MLQLIDLIFKDLNSNKIFYKLILFIIIIKYKNNQRFLNLLLIEFRNFLFNLLNYKFFLFKVNLLNHQLQYFQNYSFSHFITLQF